MLELYCTDYITKKKFFGGHEQDRYSAMSFIKGIENELHIFKEKEEIGIKVASVSVFEKLFLPSKVSL